MGVPLGGCAETECGRMLQSTAGLGMAAPSSWKERGALPCRMLGQYRGRGRGGWSHCMEAGTLASGLWARPCLSAQVAEGMGIIRTK